MKKFNKLILILFSCFMMVGCNNKTKNQETISLDEVRLGINSAVKDIKDGKYSNLSIGDINVKITESNSLKQLQLSTEYNYFIDSEKYIEEVPNIIKFLLQDDNINNDYIFDPNSDDKYNDLVEKCKNKDFENPMINYDDGEKYVSFGPTMNYIWMVKDNLKKKYGQNSEEFSTLVSSKFDIVKTYLVNENIDLKKEIYKLVDGEYSVQDAIEFVENYYNNEFKYNNNKDFTIDVYKVKVLSLDESTYAYQFLVRREYKGIPFDTLENGASPNDFGNRVFDVGECLVAYKDSIESIVGVYPNDLINKEDNKVDKIISLSDAISNISEELTNETVFDIESIELLYVESTLKETLDKAVPTWKVTAFNKTDNSTIYAYCDVITGEVSTLVVY